MRLVPAAAEHSRSIAEIYRQAFPESIALFSPQRPGKTAPPFGARLCPALQRGCPRRTGPDRRWRGCRLPALHNFPAGRARRRLSRPRSAGADGVSPEPAGNRQTLGEPALNDPHSAQKQKYPDPRPPYSPWLCSCLPGAGSGYSAFRPRPGPAAGPVRGP